MSKRFIVVGSILAILFLSLLIPTQSKAQDLPEGITFEVVKEYPASSIPGAKSVKLMLATFAPGAKLENFTNPTVNICTGLTGELRVVFPNKGTTMRRAGEQWIEEKGVTMSLYNDGDVTFVDSFIMIEY